MIISCIFLLVFQLVSLVCSDFEGHNGKFADYKNGRMINDSYMFDDINDNNSKNEELLGFNFNNFTRDESSDNAMLDDDSIRYISFIEGISVPDEVKPVDDLGGVDFEKEMLNVTNPINTVSISPQKTADIGRNVKVPFKTVVDNNVRFIQKETCCCNTSCRSPNNY